jgi:hypothetical protein
MAKDFGFDESSKHGRSSAVALILFYMNFEPILVVIILFNHCFRRSIEFTADKFAVDHGHG